ncbi:MAG: hypothetical protein Q8P20_04975 [bacterium]|nr:hypothetical protein [bacterium]
MLETSNDFVNIAIGSAVIIFTFFLCWALYYIVMMLKRASQASKEITEFISSLKEKLNKFEDLLTTIEEKIKHSTSYIPMIMKGVSELIDYIKRKKENKIEKKNSKK